MDKGLKKKINYFLLIIVGTMAAGDVGEKRASKIRISKSHEEFGFYSNANPCFMCVCRDLK